MSGFFGTGSADVVATWVAAAATIVVLGGMFGEKRLFAWSQHLFAGLATGLLGLLVVSEVLVPRLLVPLAEDPLGRPALWAGLVLVGLAAGVPWLPRPIAVAPLSIAIGGLAAFALGGAVVGTLLPQTGAAMPPADAAPATMTVAVVSSAITVLVLIGFLRGRPRGRLWGPATGAGRWLLVVGIGGWLGYLLLSRLVLMVDRIGFLLGEWLGLGG